MQDKNFTVRLQAAIDKRLKAHGILKHGLSFSDEKHMAFIESLKEITLDYLQGEKKAPTFAEAPKP